MATAIKLKNNKGLGVEAASKAILGGSYATSTNYFNGADGTANTARYLASASNEALYEKKLFLKKQFISDAAQVKIDYLALDEAMHKDANDLQIKLNTFYMESIGYGNEKARALSAEMRNMYINHMKQAVNDLYEGIDITSMSGHSAPRELV